MGNCTNCGKDIPWKFFGGTGYCDGCGEKLCENCYAKVKTCDKCDAELCPKCFAKHTCEEEEQEEEQEEESEDGEENKITITYSPDKKFAYLYLEGFSSYTAELDAISMLNSQGYMPITVVTDNDYEQPNHRLLFRKKVTSEDGANK